jgi:hypothetical protein
LGERSTGLALFGRRRRIQAILPTDPDRPSEVVQVSLTDVRRPSPPDIPTVTTMENKRKHLEFIHGVINRMSNTSFLLKGWSITVVAGLFALGAKDGAVSVLVLAVVLTSVFWFLDSFFLWQERLYRELYDDVRQKHEDEINFSMDASRFSEKRKWYHAPFSVTLWPFYTSVLSTLVIFLIKLIIK